MKAKVDANLLKDFMVSKFPNFENYYIFRKQFICSYAMSQFFSNIVIPPITPPNPSPDFQLHSASQPEHRPLFRPCLPGLFADPPQLREGLSHGRLNQLYEAHSQFPELYHVDGNIGPVWNGRVGGYIGY